MASPFVEVERKYRSLFSSYQNGDFDADAFAQALEALAFQDDQEQWWQIQGDGNWLRYDGERWEAAVPPRPTPPPPPRAVLLPPPRPQVEPGVEVDDDSVFRNTGVSAEQIPGLLNPQPAPGAFLIEPAPVVAATPQLVQVAPAPLAIAPQRPATAPPEAPPAVCSQCQARLVPAAKFCGKCGHPVAAGGRIER